MPTSSTTLEILIKLKDEASAAMQGLGSNLKSLGDQMTGMGRTLTTDVTLPLVGFGVYAIKGAMDFQQAMTLVQTQAGASATEVAALSDQVMQLATHSQQGPTELANGLYHLISLGLNASDAMAALKVSSQGAAVGQEDLEGVTNALGGAISSGIKGTSDYARTMGELDATIGAGNMKMGDLVAALGTGILPAARSAGLALTDVSAALATMTDNGVPADEAATRLRMTFSLLAAPTQQAQKALAEVGITSTQLAEDMRQPNGLLVAVMDLKTHLENSGKSAVEQNAIIAQAFGGGRSSSAIETLIQQTDKLSSKYTYLADNTDKFANSVNVEAATWQGQMQNMNANMQVFRDTVGKSLLEIANQVFPIVINVLQDLVKAWNDLSPGMQKFIIYAGVIAAVLGPVLLVLGFLISTIGSVIAFVGGFIGILTTLIAFIPTVVTALMAVVVAIGFWPILIGIAVIAVVALIVTHWTQIMTFLKTTWDQIGALLQLFLNGIEIAWRTVWEGISSFFGGIWSGIKSTLSSVLSFLKNEIHAFTSWATGVFQPVLDAVNKIGSVASGFGKAVGGAFSGAANLLHLATGGIVSSPTLALVGEAGPEAVIPLSAFNGGSSLAGAGGFSTGGNIVVNINGGTYLDGNVANDIANMIAKRLNQQLRLRNYQS